jgi:hypothetical protein
MPDYDFWLRLGLYGRFIRVPRVLAGFRVHEGSQTYSQTTVERAAEPVLIVAGVLNTDTSLTLSLDLKQRAMASAHLVSAQLHLRAGRLGDALNNIQAAMSYSLITVFALYSVRLLFNAAFNRFFHRLLWTMRAMLGKSNG